MSDKLTKTAEKLVCFFARPHSEVFARRDEGGKAKITGYAAMYDRFSEDLGGYRTKIAPGAFDRVIQAADCRFLVNHDPNLLLGRTTSGTLRLFTDAKGLGFEAEPPASAITDHYAAAIERGDMDGCSFTCDIDIDQWDFSGETPIRTLIGLSELYDIGPVTYPAFRDTSVAVSHALEAARAALVIKVLRPSLSLMRYGIELAR